MNASAKAFVIPADCSGEFDETLRLSSAVFTTGFTLKLAKKRSRRHPQILRGDDLLGDVALLRELRERLGGLFAVLQHQGVQNRQRGVVLL